MINSTHIPISKQLWKEIAFIVDLANQSTVSNAKYSKTNEVNIEYILVDRLLELFDKLKNNMPEIYYQTLTQENKQSNEIKIAE